MINDTKKYRGIKFLNVEQKFLNVKVLNKNKIQKSISINTPNSSNKSKDQSIKSSINDNPNRTEEEKSTRVKNFSSKGFYKKLNSCKRINVFNDPNIFKNIKKRNFEEKKEGSASSYKINKSIPKRINSLRNYTSCKNMNLKSSFFNMSVKNNLSKKKNQTSKNLTKNNNINNQFDNKNKNTNENGKKKNKKKNKKVNNKNTNENDCINIVKVKTEKTGITDNEDNKDKNKSKNIKRFFCCL